MKGRNSLLTLSLAAGLLLAACNDDNPPLTLVEEPPDAGCIRAMEPSTYQVYFVIDVSGSMKPFLTELKDNLVAFADSLPERDSLGRRVKVEYWLIAFVNDVKVFGGGRMTSVISLQAAFDEAIDAGDTQNNLNRPTFNAETEENTLDALEQVVSLDPSAEARLVMLACDAPFLESPERLSGNNIVQSTYSTVKADLERLGVRIHAFVPTELDGITREYRHQPALTTLPGSAIHRLQDLQQANQQIKDTLSVIARGSSCN